jgi:UDP-2-acetamido-2-deoxy-ribo-hexuluronate aminotransferase
MQTIQMVDLKTQYEKIRSEINEAIQSVLDSTAFIKGPEIKLFEEEMQKYLDVNHVVSCGNGTDALQIAMMALGLKPGDEVITTNFTFVATVEVVALLGLKLVIVEPEPDSFNISVDAIRKAITPRTKAIVPVHLFGQCAKMEEIMKLAKENSLFVIEDTAQANGAEYIFSDGTTKKAGTIGDIGCTSFFPSKNLGCFGDGGALFTNNDDIAVKLRSIINHGMKVRYHHDNIGVNSRLDTIQAAILRIKLKKLDEYNAARINAAGVYDKAFRSVCGIIPPIRVKYSTHIFHQYTLKVKDGKRDKLKDHLESKNIPSMIYYPIPLHMQKAYSSLGYKEGDFPVTEALCTKVLSLPMHTELDNEQLEYITGGVRDFFEKQ